MLGERVEVAANRAGEEGDVLADDGLRACASASRDAMWGVGTGTYHSGAQVVEADCLNVDAIKAAGRELAQCNERCRV